METKIKAILKNHSSQNIPLNFEDAYALGEYAMLGCTIDDNQLAQIQSTVVMTALHNMATYRWQNSEGNKKLPQNAAEQIAGVCAAIFEKDIALSPLGFLRPNVPYAMDNCGMGGDVVLTANVSTIAALIASADGIPMCKHGSPGNATKCGSSDFVSMLGFNTSHSKEDVEKQIETDSFAYTEALDVRFKRIHMQTHKFAKLPHMADIIGPITNPLSPQLLSRRVLGVNHLVSPRLVAEAYQILNERGVTNLQHGLFVRGFVDSRHYEGMDEISICGGGTQVAELRNGVISEYHLQASDFGLEPVLMEEISPPLGMSKGDFSLGILKGEITGAPLQMVLANAAILFYLAEKSADLKECYAMAKVVHESGRTYQKVLDISKRTPK